MSLFCVYERVCVLFREDFGKLGLGFFFIERYFVLIGTLLGCGLEGCILFYLVEEIKVRKGFLEDLLSSFVGLNICFCTGFDVFLLFCLFFYIIVAVCCGSLGKGI